jgi:hypothetical protein
VLGTAAAICFTLSLLGVVPGDAQAGKGGDDAGKCVSACGGFGRGNNLKNCYCDS